MELVDFKNEAKNESNKTENYDSERLWYVEKYGADIPSAKAGLKLSIVVPTFAEMSNDNFWRLLRSIMYQKDVDTNSFEVVCVINNSEEIANSNGGSIGSNQFESRDGKKRYDRYKENQSQIKLIELVREGQKIVSSNFSELDVTEWLNGEIKRKNIELSINERKLLNRFIRTKHTLLCVDASSPGKGLMVDTKTSPISLARDIGSYLVQKRFNELGQKGLIDFLDGDCFMEPGYVNKMMKYIDSGAQVVVKPLKKVVAEIPREILDEHSRYVRVMSAVKYLSTVQTGYDYYGDIFESYELDKKMFPLNKKLGGPQIAVRSDVIREVGGYPTVKYNGDWEFSKKVISKIRPEEIHCMNGSVLMSDRGRDVSIDGKSRAVLTEYLTNTLQRDPMVESRNKSTINQISQDESIFLHDLGALASGHVEQNNLLKEYNDIKWGLFSQSKGERIHLINKVEKWVKLIVEHNYTSLDPNDIIDKIYSSEKVKKTDKDFFELNTVVVELVLEVIKLAKNDSQTKEELVAFTMIWLEKLLPEYFSKPPSSPSDIHSLSRSNNISDYKHIPEAIYLMKSRINKRHLAT